MHEAGGGPGRDGQSPGHPQSGHGQAGAAGQCMQDRPHRHVLPAQDVAASPSAVLEGGHMAEGQVIDVGDVHGRVHEPGHPPVQEVKHDLAGRGGANVTGPERKGRQGDADVKPFGAGAQHLMLGDELGPLVRAGQVGEVGVARLVAGRGIGGRPDREHPDRGGVHQPLAPGGPGRPEHVERSAHVHVVEDARVAGPEPVDGREVEDEAGARAGGPDGGGVPDVGHYPLGVHRVEVAAVSPRFDDGDDARAPFSQRPGDRRPYEPRGPGDDHSVPWLDPRAGTHMSLRMGLPSPLPAL